MYTNCSVYMPIFISRSIPARSTLFDCQYQPIKSGMIGPVLKIRVV